MIDDLHNYYQNRLTDYLEDDWPTMPPPEDVLPNDILRPDLYPKNPIGGEDE